MARGYFGGIIAGTLVSGAVLGTVSVMTDTPGANAPDAVALEVPAGSEFNQSREDKPVDLPAVEDLPGENKSPEIVASEPDDISALQDASKAPDAQPESGVADAILDSPIAGEGVDDIEISVETPVLPSQQTAAPEAPTEEDDLSISTEPAQPVQPVIAEESSTFAVVEDQTEPAIELEAQDEPIVEPAEDKIAVLTEPLQPAQPEIEQENSAFPDVTEADTKTTDAEEPADVQAPEPEVVEITEPEAAEVAEPEVVVEEPTTPAAMPEIEPATSTETESGTEAASSSVVKDLAPKVTTNRLPSVTSTDAPEAAGADTETAEQDPLVLDGLPPLQRFAVEFENPDNKPLMSIVLIDDGSSPIGLDALASFPYPLSFAVDVTWDGAAQAAKKYRDAGFEVLAMINMPEAANARDTEVAMQAYLDVLPEAVAVMEGDGTGLQTSREVSGQLTPILLDSGHGLVMFSKGLNTAQKLIARSGVPSASVFRDFDANGQEATTIRRFLDKAAFKSTQQDDGVVMVGRLRADTISALILWGLQDKARRVALAPISAVLSGTE